MLGGRGDGGNQTELASTVVSVSEEQLFARKCLAGPSPLTPGHGKRVGGAAIRWEMFLSHPGQHTNIGKLNTGDTTQAKKHQGKSHKSTFVYFR